MSLSLILLSLFGIGIGLIALGIYVFRLYRAAFRSDPGGSISRDLFSILMFGSWAAIPLFAAVMCYAGTALCAIGFVFVWEEFFVQH